MYKVCIVDVSVIVIPVFIIINTQIFQGNMKKALSCDTKSDHSTGKFRECLGC